MKLMQRYGPRRLSLHLPDIHYYRLCNLRPLMRSYLVQTYH